MIVVIDERGRRHTFQALRWMLHDDGSVEIFERAGGSALGRFGPEVTLLVYCPFCDQHVLTRGPAEEPVAAPG